MKISRGRMAVPYKTVIYGPEGIGKSTLASQFPDPLFIDTEGSTARMNVARIELPNNWKELLETIEDVAREKPCKTLVIDTVDWALKACSDFVVKTYAPDGKALKSIEDFGYGAGYTFLEEEMQKLIHRLEDCLRAGVHVVLTAHAQIKTFTLPDQMGSYERWELKLDRKSTGKIAPMIKEWGDMVLFCNYETTLIQDSNGMQKKGKGVGGQRVMFATHNPAYDAKNRDGLPDKMPMAWDSIKHLFEEAPQPKVETQIKPTEPKVHPEYVGLPDELVKRFTADEITPEDIHHLMAGHPGMAQFADTPINQLPEQFINDMFLNKDNYEVMKFQLEKETF